MANTTELKGAYAKALAQNEKEKDAAQIPFKVEEASLGLQASLLQTRKELSKANLKLAGLKSTFPLDFQAILDTQVEISELTSAIASLSALQVELFEG